MALNYHDAIRNNQRKSALIMVAFFLFAAILFGIASILINLNVFINPQDGDFGKLILTFLFFMTVTIIYIFYFLKSGDKMILNVVGAKETTRKDYPFLFHTTEALSLAAGMRKPPKCYVIKDTALNAFATGFSPDKSYVVVTTGLIDKLTRQELEGVLAHEISHIVNRDIKLMLYVAGLIGVFTLIGTFCYYAMLTHTSSKEGDKMKIVFFGLWILFSVIAPIFALFFKFALSREREYLADASGAKLTRYPEGLASALEKIKGDPDPLVDHANKATAHLFISTPFRKTKIGFKGLFATHPPIDDRIKKLRGQKI